MLLCAFLASEIINDEAVFDSLGAFPQNISLVIARFIASLVLHLCLSQETARALATMKFANNHEYRFENA